MEVVRTCLNRMIGRCPDCVQDYSDQHPNNDDCPEHRAIEIIVFEVTEKPG